MRSHIATPFIKAGLLISSLMLVGCSDMRLKGIPDEPVSPESVGEFCTLPPDSLKRYTKFMFIMDKSGSNATTDPGAAKRATNIEKFYNENKDNPGYRWGMIGFQSGGTRGFIGGEDTPTFTDQEPEVRDAIQLLRGNDGGGTPYREALDLTRQAILNDIELYPDEENLYMLFFVTDGEPTDIHSDDELMGLVRDLRDIDSNRIYMSTAYYGPNSSSAIHRLQRMADEGGGKFVNFNNTDNLDFNDLIVGPTKEPWQIKNFLVYNLNSSICEDGAFGMDSDADGLCDVDEEKYGLDPAKRFSRPGGYGDYFIWRSIKYHETLKPCLDADARSDEDFDLLTKCEEAYIFNSTGNTANPSLPAPRNGDAKNPDTDLDGYIDGLEIFMFRDKASPMTARNVLDTFDYEPESSGTQIKQHRNPLLRDPDAFRYDTYIEQTSIDMDTAQTCYSFKQNHLQVFGKTLEVKAEDNFPHLAHEAGHNTVLVYFIQTQQREPDAKGVFMHSYQDLKVYSKGISDSIGVAGGLKVRDDKFTAYVVPK